MSTPSPWAADRRARPRTGSPVRSCSERAVGYTRGVADAGRHAPTSDARTPCARLGPARPAAAHERLARGVHRGRRDRVRRPGARARRPTRAVELVERLRNRACALLAAWAHHPGDRAGRRSRDRALRSDLLAAAGSLEIAVHGWDVAQACGVDRPLPAGARPGAARRACRCSCDDADRPAPVRRARRRTPARAAEHPAARRARPPSPPARRRLGRSQPDPEEPS